MRWRGRPRRRATRARAWRSGCLGTRRDFRDASTLRPPFLSGGGLQTPGSLPQAWKLVRGGGEAGEGTALICPLALVLLGFCCCGYAAAVQSSDQCDPIWKCLRNFQRRLANQVSFTVGCLGSDGNLCVFAIDV